MGGQDGPQLVKDWPEQYYAQEFHTYSARKPTPYMDKLRVPSGDDTADLDEKDAVGRGHRTRLARGESKSSSRLVCPHGDEDHSNSR